MKRRSRGGRLESQVEVARASSAVAGEEGEMGRLQMAATSLQETGNEQVYPEMVGWCQALGVPKLVQPEQVV